MVTSRLLFLPLQTKELPEITDKFVKANTDYDSVDAFQKGMKKEVINDKKSDNMDLISQDLITAAVEKATFKDDYPQDLYDKAKSDIDASLDSSAESFSMERKDFLEMFYGMAEEDLKEDYLNETHSRLVLYAIAQKESLFPTKKQYQSYLEVSSYPGTPSTEVTEEAAKYDEIYCEWAPNEKVAMEVAFGACLAGKRSFCGMKHVGMNPGR